MSSIDSSLKAVLSRYLNNKSDISNEAQTKQYIVLPILSSLGFDVNNPIDLLAEFTADVAGKKGEKIDYAIKIDNQITLLLECKHHTSKLDENDRSQLERYFRCGESTEFARIAILSNGITWKFFTDSKRERVLDKDPFFVFDLRDSGDYEGMLYFTKDNFRIDNVLEKAKEREDVLQIRSFIDDLFSLKRDNEISEIKNIMIALSKYGCSFGKLTESKINNLVAPLMIAREEFLKDFISKKFFTESSEEKEEKNEFTQLETDSYNVILAIASEVCSISDLELRNLKGLGRSYILFRHSQRMPVVTMNFIKKPYSVLIGKSNDSYKIEHFSDIYQYKQEIIDALNSYIGANQQAA